MHSRWLIARWHQRAKRHLLPATGPQHSLLSGDEKLAVGISGGFQSQKHGHKPGIQNNLSLKRYY